MKFISASVFIALTLFSFSAHPNSFSFFCDATSYGFEKNTLRWDNYGERKYLIELDGNELIMKNLEDSTYDSTFQAYVEKDFIKGFADPIYGDGWTKLIVINVKTGDMVFMSTTFEFGETVIRSKCNKL